MVDVTHEIPSSIQGGVKDGWRHEKEHVPQAADIWEILQSWFPPN